MNNVKELKSINHTSDFKDWVTKEYEAARKKLEAIGFKLSQGQINDGLYVRLLDEYKDKLIGTFDIDDFKHELLTNPQLFENKKVRVYTVYTDYSEKFETSFYSLNRYRTEESGDSDE